MSAAESIVLTVAEDVGALEGKLFQAHALPGGRLKLYPVELTHDGRCPVIVGGGRCYGKAGHDGRHAWGSAD